MGVLLITMAVVVIIIIVTVSVAVIMAVIMAVVMAPGKSFKKNPEKSFPWRKGRSPSGLLTRDKARVGVIGTPINISPA